MFLRELTALSRRYDAEVAAPEAPTLTVRTRDGVAHVVRYDLREGRYVPVDEGDQTSKRW